MMSPKPDATPQEMFIRAGRALCPGDQWQADLTRLLGVRKGTVQQWASGHLHLRPDHFATLLSLLVERQAAMAEAEAKVRDWLARQPAEPDRT